MSAQHLTVEVRDRIMHIRMNRPDKKNALTGAMYTAFADALASAETDPGVRVIFITGTADCFTSGNDLKDFLENPPQGENSPVGRFLRGVSIATKPMVAAVNGAAIGVGTTMLLHCDLVYAGRGARFQMPFVNIGLCPEAASSVIVPALVGHQRAAELLMLGEAFDAERAREFGLVNAVLDDVDCEVKALGQAQRLAMQPPAALRTCKALLKRAQQSLVEQTIRDEAQTFFKMLLQPEAREAMTAFMQKRKPDFSRFD